jgi:hypothetical protein
MHCISFLALYLEKIALLLANQDREFFSCILLVSETNLSQILCLIPFARNENRLFISYFR